MLAGLEQESVVESILDTVEFESPLSQLASACTRKYLSGLIGGIGEKTEQSILKLIEEVDPSLKSTSTDDRRSMEFESAPDEAKRQMILDAFNTLTTSQKYPAIKKGGTTFIRRDILEEMIIGTEPANNELAWQKNRKLPFTEICSQVFEKRMIMGNAIYVCMRAGIA